VTEGDAEPRHPALSSWYSYSYFSHVLTPKPHVWALRLAAGGYAKLEFVSYYCPSLEPGCVTFRYVYQGDGSRELGGGLRPPSDGRHAPGGAFLPASPQVRIAPAKPALE